MMSFGGDMTYLEVAETLERFVEGSAKRWEWDDFMATKFRDDLYLSQLQERVSSLDIEFPPTQTGHYCSPEGLRVILDYARDLRSKDAPSKGIIGA
jgi:hypothetical protein